ncbi:DNA integrity scanning diadenylate cyclase DisA [Natranaerofaba carboxydovora]|uniref:DNA integrity scanning diadenylate cyclase DisA n=1 Tax=Natranaerofaba carboxydovora TaxID=2742683 RepID=UPI001F12B73D|nr:DNA integrity scanning diadenylate cyclase DisA [Natranaerofaba carboxydovora]UMZ75364.1 DNA integrity scanning protein DisA [Natranaerofaba carboxydovora]
MLESKRQGKKENEFLETLAMVAPGTPLREGIEAIVNGTTGGLLVLGYSDPIKKLITGGFKIDIEFSSSSLYELSKMDGAIILSHDSKRIIYANAHLNPSQSIISRETGMRHITAERVAKQTGERVLAISQRRNVITIYHKNLRYPLNNISMILTKANQAVETLEKYKAVLEQNLINLTALEFEEAVSFHDVVKALQRSEMVMRIVSEIERYITELGTEGRLVKMQLDELIVNVADEEYLLIKDFYYDEKQDLEKVKEKISALSADDLMDPEKISEILGYPRNINALDRRLSSRGYRILNKIPRLPMSVIENVVGTYKDLKGIREATVEQLDRVEGIGKVRANAIKDGMKRIREQALIDRYI